MKPDYWGGGIVNLMSSLGQVFGAPVTQYPPLSLVDLTKHLRARRVILMVIDGLGYHQLNGCAVANTLNKHLVGSMTSVFPSTTASAITTFLTGVAPQQHGLVGWHTYFKEIDQVFTPLRFVPRGAGQTISESVTPASLFAHLPFLSQLNVPAHTVSPASIAHSAYNEFHSGAGAIHSYKKLSEFFQILSDICHRSDHPFFTYAYYPEIDFLSHLHGSMSKAVNRNLEALDKHFECFLESIDGTNTTVLVSADHGFVDPGREQRLDLSDYPEILQTLSKPLCGEPRVAYCYVKPGKQERFQALVEAQLNGKAVLFPSEELVQTGYFGFGEIHPELHDRTGDFTLLMQTEHMLKDWLPDEKPFDFRGIHGGISEREMLVPLCIANA